MKEKKGTLKICPKGHSFYKGSDCPVCPVCEKEKGSSEGFLSMVSAPARRALERQKITSLKKLAGYKEEELLNMHGIGPSSIPKLKQALAKMKLKLKE